MLLGHLYLFCCRNTDPCVGMSVGSGPEEMVAITLCLGCIWRGAASPDKPTKGSEMNTWSCPWPLIHKSVYANGREHDFLQHAVVLEGYPKPYTQTQHVDCSGDDLSFMRLMAVIILLFFHEAYRVWSLYSKRVSFQPKGSKVPIRYKVWFL